jgi:hypothetical protein
MSGGLKLNLEFTTCASNDGLAIDLGSMTGGAGAVIGASCSSSHT